jgi:hypothetical protein
VESRTRYAIGGVSTVIASVAVVCAVALTNSVALADSAGVPVRSSGVVVPTPTASGTVAAAPSAVAIATPPAAPEASAAETVPAPDPIAVAAQTLPTEDSQSTAEAAVVEGEASGDWNAVRQWANRNGWDQGRIDAWVERLEQKRAAAVDRPSNAPKVDAGDTSLTKDDGRWAASDSSKTSAKADHRAERQSAKAGFGSKKDQSRDSPD